MKMQYIKPLAFVGVALVMAGCTENSWNSTFLDGFDGESTYDNAVTVDYTLTTNDYETIGKALQNIATTDEEIAAARAIQNNHYFDQNSPFPSQVAVPYFLNQEKTNFYIYNSGSTVNVNLLQAEVPAEISAISASKMLTVDEDTAPTAIPGMLLEEFPDAQAGDYAIVSIGGTSNAGVTWTVAQALEQMSNGFEGEATVKGVVSSINEISTTYGNATYFIKDDLDSDEELEVYRGYYLDNTKFTSEDQLQIGATVTVTGSLVNFNGTFEFTSGNYITAIEAPATKSRSHKTRASLTSNIKNLTEGQTLTATAVVTAQSTRGLILTDNAGSIFYYNNNVDLGTYAIGTVVEVSGAVSVYGTGFQLGNTATISTAGTETYTYPTPTNYTADMVTAAIANTTPNTAQYVTLEGTLSISGNYYNINIPGVETGQGSLYTPSEAILNTIADGNTYKFTGYYTGVTSGKYFYMVLTGAEYVSGDNKPGTGGSGSGSGGNGSGSGSGDNNGGSTGGDNSNAQPGDIVIYTFNGSAWVAPEDAAVMQPSGYEALGLSNNKVTEPAIYLPLYMKSAYPFAAAGTEIYLAYNLGNSSCSCALMSYDGYNWTYVDNFIENKVAAFQKNGQDYTFRKFIGEEVFKFYEGEKIGLNCSYLIVYGGVCMTPVPTGKSYGYPEETPVTITENQIVMSSGDCAFNFVTTTEYNGNTYTAPEGYFMILDSNERYMYLQGTYSSFNVRANNAYIDTDGTINVQYLFKATKESDGTWRIVNEQEGITRTLYYSDGNNDFAGYTDEQLQRYNGKLPYLYISETSDPNAEDSGAE